MPRISFVLLSSLLLLAASPRAQAQKVLIWGIQDGCEALPEMDKILYKNLKKGAQDVELLFPKASSCVGEGCAKLLRAQCGASLPAGSQTARLLGGRIYRTQHRSTSRFRLWLHDLGSGQTAFSDTYCQDCNLIYSLPAAVDALLQGPRMRGTAPGPTPLYCGAEGAGAPAMSAPRSPVSRYLVGVYGDGKHSKQVLAGVKPMMRQTLLPIEYAKDLRSSDPAEARRVLGGLRDAQVVGIELPREGGANLWLYDAATDKSQSARVDCPACESDELLRRIDTALTPLLSTCFDGSCAGAQSKPYPEEACLPLPDLSCGDGAFATGAEAAGRPHLDRATANWVKAGLWGGVAVSGAVALGLAIANPLVTRDVQGVTYSNTLTGPAWTAAGLSAALLAIAIPTTVVVQRAQHGSSGGGDGRRGGALECPK